MIEYLEYFVGIVLGGAFIIFMGYGCYASSIMLSYRSQLRKITGGYYDHEIDTVLKEWGMTREECLRKYGYIYGEK